MQIIFHFLQPWVTINIFERTYSKRFYTYMNNDYTYIPILQLNWAQYKKKISRVGNKEVSKSEHSTHFNFKQTPEKHPQTSNIFLLHYDLSIMINQIQNTK